jgi:dihydrofolate reductase
VADSSRAWGGRGFGMGNLIYTMLASLDGYMEDASGGFQWAAPDAEVHAFINERTRGIGTHLAGRRMYEMMVYWDTPASELVDEPAEIREFAEIWKTSDKVIYSTTLAEVATARTRIERTFDPAAVREMKAAGARDLSIGGADLAGQAMRAGLVDELELYIAPVVVGGGKPWLPRDVALELELVEERRFGGGMVLVRYAVRS